jgi:predicted nucleic acid binding AN1-type Zn finger protein
MVSKSEEDSAPIFCMNDSESIICHHTFVPTHMSDFAIKHLGVISQALHEAEKNGRKSLKTKWRLIRISTLRRTI